MLAEILVIEKPLTLPLTSKRSQVNGLSSQVLSL